MRAIVYLILILSTTVVLSGCIKKSGYYDAGQKKRIEQLTNKKWERDYRSTYYGYDVHEIWRFGDNGKGSWRTIRTYTDGGIRDTTTYFSWAFTTPQFNVIYMDYPRYWLIDKIDANKLCIYLTYEDPVSVSGQERIYQEYTFKPKEEKEKRGVSQSNPK